MQALIASVRILINDTSGTPTFTDQIIQDVMDEGRLDAINQSLTPAPTFTGSTIQYLDYYSDAGSWEDGFTLKQYLTVPITASSYEPIPGHFVFATTTLPPVFITGHLHDRYRAAADLLERWAAMWAMSYNLSADGQNLQRGQVMPALLNLANSYRKKQRAHVIRFDRSDTQEQPQGNGLGANQIDFIASGNG